MAYLSHAALGIAARFLSSFMVWVRGVPTNLLSATLR
jgi:hypothetical protein